MRPTLRSFVVAGVATLALGMAPDARAEGEASDIDLHAQPKRPWELALRGGYTTPPIRGGTTPFGGGGGGRLGLVASNVYVGVSVVGYLGGQDVDITDRSVLYGGELGYGVRLDTGDGTFVTIRPQVGLGGFTLFHTDPSGGSGGTTTPSSSRSGRGRTVDTVTSASKQSATTMVNNVYVQPGVAVLFGTAGAPFFGVSGYSIVIPGIAYSGADPATWVSYGLEGQVGLRF